MIAGRMSPAAKQAYRSFLSYRRVYDEAWIVASLVLLGTWLLLFRGAYVLPALLAWIALGAVSELYGREALWHFVPPRVRRVMPKEPLDAMSMPAPLTSYRALLQAWSLPVSE
jgi:hypothetical protein